MDHWIVACAAAMLLARVGLALYTCGLVRAKNSGGALLRHVADLCLATLGFWAVGMAIILAPYGKVLPIDWSSLFGLHRMTPSFEQQLFHTLVIALFATGIVVGALSERSRFFPSLVPALLLGAVGVPLIVRWVLPPGWLGNLGFHDYAGASFVHLAAGACALAGVIVIGPRNGKYNRDGSSNVIPGHSLPLACTGVLLLLIAWFPYLLGFSAWPNDGLVALNALLAAAAGGFVSLIVGKIRYGKPDIYLTLTGLIGGLVAITAPADLVGNASAVLIGAIAGLLVPWFLLQIDLVWKIDDPTGAIAIHGIGGAWSLLAAGLFATTQSVGQKLKLLGVQALGLLVIAALIAALTAAVLLLLKRFVDLRAREADEFDGLDLAEHDIGSYPDFQQTMIKSYHLREA